MICDIFNEMESSNLVDWGVVYWGCQGLPIGILPPCYISDYACKQLALLEPIDESFTSIAVLSICTEISCETREMIMEICKQHEVDMMVSRRKWLVFALKYFMIQLPNDSLYGPLAINEFWLEWGDVDGSPNIIQGVGNSIAPRDFYSPQNYSRIVSQHNVWIANELKKFVK